MSWSEVEVGAVNFAEGTASWETMRLQPLASRGVPAAAADPQGATPLFDQLARLWHSQRRQVPGEPDPEWHALVSRGPGRRRRPSDQTWWTPDW
jgi:hypothetical protein